MFRLLACLALLVFAGFSQVHPAAAPASNSTKKPTTPGHSANNDAEIEKTIRAKLAKSKISTDNFQVRVQGGVATITGRTNVMQHKGTATRLAKSGGATKVVNQVEISEAAKEQAAKNLASGTRRAQVKRGEAR